MNMGASRINSRGMATVKVLVLIPLAIIALTFGFYEARKAYWDYQVDKLCEQDGGVKINEVMHLDTQQYERLIDKKLGTRQLVIPKESSPEGVGAAVYYRLRQEEIRSHNPRVSKSIYVLVRAADGVEIASSIRYGRGDGDLISLHPSSHSCPKPLASVVTVESAIQLNKELK